MHRDRCRYRCAVITHSRLSAVSGLPRGKKNSESHTLGMYVVIILLTALQEPLRSDDVAFDGRLSFRYNSGQWERLATRGSDVTPHALANQSGAIGGHFTIPQLSQTPSLPLSHHTYYWGWLEAHIGLWAEVMQQMLWDCWQQEKAQYKCHSLLTNQISTEDGSGHGTFPIEDVAAPHITEYWTRKKAMH